MPQETETLRRATGSTIDAKPYLAYLKKKYGRARRGLTALGADHVGSPPKADQTYVTFGGAIPAFSIVFEFEAEPRLFLSGTNEDGMRVIESLPERYRSLLLELVLLGLGGLPDDD